MNSDIIIFAIFAVGAAGTVAAAPAPVLRNQEASLIKRLQKPGIELIYDRDGRVVGVSLSHLASDADFSLLADLPHLTHLSLYVSPGQCPTLRGLVAFKKLRQIKCLLVWDSDMPDHVYRELESKTASDCMFLSLPY